MKFEQRWQAMKWVLDKPGLKATEVMFMVDQVYGGQNSGDGT